MEETKRVTVTRIRKLDELKRGITYFFDNHSMDCGIFQEIVDKGNYKQVRFIPVHNKRYTLHDGHINIAIFPNDEVGDNLEFFKEKK